MILICQIYKTDVFEDDTTVGNQINEDNINVEILTLTDAQRIIFNIVSNAINEECNDKCIFVDGPGGSRR